MLPQPTVKRDSPGIHEAAGELMSNTKGGREGGEIDSEGRGRKGCEVTLYCTGKGENIREGKGKWKREREIKKKGMLTFISYLLV